jgi:hypothetical protein
MKQPREESKERTFLISFGFGLLLLAGGCMPSSAQDLRKTPEFRGVYRSSLGYEDIYRRILTDAEAEIGRETESGETSIHHAIFPESGEAWVWWQDKSGITYGVTVFLCEIRRAESGSVIEARATERYWWRRVDRRLRQIGAVPVSGE